MAVIGIESSAHTFGVGVVEKGRILANEKAMYRIGATGMIPNKVAETHIENTPQVIELAIEKSGIKLRDIKAVSYTMGPGLGPCLQVGMLSAKALATKLGVKLVPINHGVAHVEITKHITGFKGPLALYVSGGNSQILKLDRKRGRYAVLGETFDVGIGNMLDAFARELKLNPAWGSKIEETARGGRYIRMPYTVKGMDFAFTGLLTHAKSLIGKERAKDICYSIQQTSFSMLCEATERAALLTNSKEIAVCGGVAQSDTLAKMLASMSKAHSMKFGRAQNEYNADNGAMIAVLGEKVMGYGAVDIRECDIKQRYRVDEMIIHD